MVPVRNRGPFASPGAGGRSQTPIVSAGRPGGRDSVPVDRHRSAQENDHDVHGPQRRPRRQCRLRRVVRCQGGPRPAAGAPIRDPHLHGRPPRPGQVRRSSAKATPTSSATPAAARATTRSARSSSRTSCSARPNGSSSTTPTAGWSSSPTRSIRGAARPAASRRPPLGPDGFYDVGDAVRARREARRASTGCCIADQTRQRASTTSGGSGTIRSCPTAIADLRLSSTTSGSGRLDRGQGGDRRSAAPP